MAKAVGRVTLPEERQGWLRSMLMRHYEGNRAFRKDWSLHLSRYKRLIKALVHPVIGDPRHPWAEHYAYDDRAWQALEAAIDRGPVETTVGGEQRVSTRGREHMVRQSCNTHLRRYRQELRDLCNKWGLRCEWAPAWLHASYVERVRGSMSAEELAALDQESFRLRRVLSLGIWGSDLHICLKVPYDPAFHDWVDVETHILAEARRQRDEIKTQSTQAGYILQHKKPELQTHIRWLYRRIALKKVPKQIALEESVGQDAVEKAIYQLARALSLRLPRNRGVSVRR